MQKLSKLGCRRLTGLLMFHNCPWRQLEEKLEGEIDFNPGDIKKTLSGKGPLDVEEVMRAICEKFDIDFDEFFIDEIRETEKPRRYQLSVSGIAELKSLLKITNFSMTQLAGKLGVHHTYLSQLINGSKSVRMKRYEAFIRRIETILDLEECLLVGHIQTVDPTEE